MQMRLQGTCGRSSEDGQMRRRSPRILALIHHDKAEAATSLKQKKQQIDGKQNHSIVGAGVQRYNRRIKRKSRHDNDNSSGALPTSARSKIAKQVWKGRDKAALENEDDNIVEWRSRHQKQILVEENKQHDIPNGSKMPAKHILELVLDTLQRRDTYEIFAEPVDPDEVEDYYEIIKEPMDFGTMRAKLHEGMYENLQQFEYDVFLIPENAMHFNSSTTIYFRQGRALHELAKKVFHALKTDPENFEVEFSGTRRRSMRKALSENKDKGCVPMPSASKKNLHSPPTSKRTTRKNPTAHYNIGMAGKRDGSRSLSNSKFRDRRSTYPSFKSSFCSEKDSSYGSKTLVLMNEGDIRYKDSLMSFVKDLGATAKMVAKRKLLQHLGKSNHNWVNGSEKIICGPAMAMDTPMQQRKFDTGNKVDGIRINTNNVFDHFAPPRNVAIIDLTTDDGEEEATLNGKTRKRSLVATTGVDDQPKTVVGDASYHHNNINNNNNGRLNVEISEDRRNERITTDITTRKRRKILTANQKKSNGHLKKKTNYDDTSEAAVGGLSLRKSSNNEFNVCRPVVLALESSHQYNSTTNSATELKSRSTIIRSIKKIKCGSSAANKYWQSWRRRKMRRQQDTLLNHESSTSRPAATDVQLTDHPLEENNKVVAVPSTAVTTTTTTTSQFTFDLPFLIARLNQMNNTTTSKSNSLLLKGMGQQVQREGIGIFQSHIGMGRTGGGELVMNSTENRGRCEIGRPQPAFLRLPRQPHQSVFNPSFHNLNPHYKKNMF